MNTPADSTALDPFPLVTGLASLRRLTGMYPASHPVITNRLDKLNQIVQQYLREDGAIQIDIMYGCVHLNGVSFGDDSPTHAQTIQELAGLGVDSIHIRDGIEPDELLKIAGLLWELKDRPQDESIEQHLVSRTSGSRHNLLAVVDRDRA